MSEKATESKKETMIIDKPWETEQGCRKLADILRGRKGMPVRHAVELGKRVEYFKGEKLASFVLNNKTVKKKFPDLAEKDDVLSVGRALVHHGFIHRSDREGNSRKTLTPSANHNFLFEGYYTWMYDGQKTLRNIMTAILIISFLICTCFPIWPQWAKVALWYLSVTFLIFVTIFCIIRLIVFFTLWMIGYEFWFLPNIFDDDLGVVDSFKPLYSFRATDVSERIYRIIGIIAFCAFSYWIKNQPTEFDEYLAMTKQLTDDLYSGKLLADMAQSQKDNLDYLKVPDLQQLMKEEEDDKVAEEPETKTPENLEQVDEDAEEAIKAAAADKDL